MLMEVSSLSPQYLTFIQLGNKQVFTSFSELVHFGLKHISQQQFKFITIAAVGTKPFNLFAVLFLHFSLLFLHSIEINTIVFVARHQLVFATQLNKKWC